MCKRRCALAGFRSVDDQFAVQQEPGDCSTSDDELMSSLQRQVLVAPVKAPSMRKHARGEPSDIEGEDEATLEKRRRVQSEEQPGSPAALCLRPRAPSRDGNTLGSSTAATPTTFRPVTAAAAAPPPEGPAVVEPIARNAHGSNATLTASTLALPAAETAQEPMSSVGRARAPQRLHHM